MHNPQHTDDDDDGDSGDEKEMEGDGCKLHSIHKPDISHTYTLFIRTYFVSCNGPCAQKEKWHRKEHIIIVIIITTTIIII